MLVVIGKKIMQCVKEGLKAENGVEKKNKEKDNCIMFSGLIKFFERFMNWVHKNKFEIKENENVMKNCKMIVGVFEKISESYSLQNVADKIKNIKERIEIIK